MPKAFYSELWDNLKNGRDWRFDVFNRRKDGTLYWAREHVSFVRDKQGRTTHYMSISQDITEIRQQELALQHQARYDQLTGIANRFLGIEQLRESIARSQAAGLLTILLFLDLDNFKYINDNLGHRTGDLILIEAAGRLRTLLGTNDTLARFGGDEFLVILDGIASVAEGEAKISKIYQQFATAFTVDGIEIHVTLSCGIAVAPNDGTDPDELIRYADPAMYHAKERGRNTFHFFDARISDSAKSRFVLETATAQAQQWQKLTATQFQMSVNISPRQFRQGKIIADLKELLARYALEPGRIKLEVTEGLLLHPYDNPVEVLNQIKSMGVGVAMDDFGTGYSSLLNLRQFSFDLLKIDRSFIHDLTETAQTRAMVNAIIAMCKSLGLQVIAEGIETTAQRDYLLQQGCTLGQGYLFAKPVPAAEFQRLLGSSFV